MAVPASLLWSPSRPDLQAQQSIPAWDTPESQAASESSSLQPVLLPYCSSSLFLWCFSAPSLSVGLSAIITWSGPPVIRWRRTSDKLISFKWLDVSLFPQAFIQVIHAFYAFFSRSLSCLGNLSSAELPSYYIKTALAALAVAKKAFILDLKNRKQKQASHYRQTSLRPSMIHKIHPFQRAWLPLLTDDYSFSCLWLLLDAVVLFVLLIVIVVIEISHIPDLFIDY